MSLSKPSSTGIDHQSPPKLNTIIDILIVLFPLVVITVLNHRIQQWGIVLGLTIVFANILRVTLATWVLHRRGISWAALGLRRPERILPTVLMGVGVGVAGMLLAALVQRFMATSFPNIPPSDTTLFDSLNGNFSLLIFTLIILWTIIAIGEELIWRVFMINRFSALFGEDHSVSILGLFASVIVFGLVHSYLGIGGVISTSVLGLVFGAAYLLSKQNVWVPVIAHGLINTISFLSFYSMCPNSTFVFISI